MIGKAYTFQLVFSQQTGIAGGFKLFIEAKKNIYRKKIYEIWKKI